MGWAGWLLVIIVALVAASFLISRYRSNQARASAPMIWKHFFEKGVFDEFPDKHTLVYTFFIPDSINPLAFFGNYFQLTPFGRFPEIPASPTPSIAAFHEGLNAPLAYPRWFIAAYPDVVLWAANRDQPALLQLMATAFGTEESARIAQTHGAEKAVEAMTRALYDDDDKYIKLPYLRRIVDLYRSQTNRSLECAL